MVEMLMPKEGVPALEKQVSQKIKIAVDEILEKYDCPVCMCRLAEPFITRCGHTFCKVSLSIPQLMLLCRAASLSA
jgi:hypothetical protein